MHVLIALLLSTAPAEAPSLASFEEEGGASELVLVCEAPTASRVLCHVTEGQVVEQAGACSFRTRRFELEFERKGPLEWTHAQTTPCDTRMVTELVGKPGDKVRAATWALTQTRTGTPVDSDACKLSNAAGKQRFVPGGGKKRPLKCTSVTMSLG